MLVLLAEELWAKAAKVLTPLYADDLSLDGLAKANARLILHVMERGPDRGYFMDPTKSIHICDNKTQVEAARATFKELGLAVKFNNGSKARQEEWVKPQVEAWAEGVQTLASFAHRYLQTAYEGLTMCLQAKWQYLQRTALQVGTLMGPIEDAFCLEFFPSLFGELDPGEVEAKWALWGHIIKCS
eukprot:12332619-Ditylum_brightwellii.AAC.1